MRMSSLQAFLTACLTVLAGCIGGNGGSDTETLTLGGRIVRQEGSPLAGGRVKLIPSDFDPSRDQAGSIQTTRTDSFGGFRFGELKNNVTYNLIAEGEDSRGRHWAYAEGLLAGSAKTTLTLKPARVFYISLHTPSYARRDSGVAYFPGTDIFTRCDGLNASKIDSIPVGLQRLVVQSRAGWKHDSLVTLDADTVRIEADSAGLRFYR